ncbi:MAG: hypothetical protein U0V75_13865 [Ferruginibacter sp.]
MSDDLKDILNNSNKDIDNQKLMDYLSKKLSAEESHELERMMAEDEFMNDAMEGLEEVGDTKKIGVSIEDLNRELQKQVAKKKLRKEKRKLKDQPWAYITIILLLLLMIVSYLVIKKMQQSPKLNEPKQQGALFVPASPKTV